MTDTDDLAQLTAERDYWRAMYEAMCAAARAGIAARQSVTEES